MKKQDLIHLHGLLGIITEETDVEVENLDEYSELSISPAAIHKSKDKHKEGVFALAGDLVEELAENESTTEEKIEI